MPLQFPEFSGYIFGEESNIFTNSFGQEVRIEVQEDSSATSKHLATVLYGNETAARLLADLIHSDIVLEKEETQALEEQLDFELPLNELAIWIDPIGKRGRFADSSSTTPVFFLIVIFFKCIYACYCVPVNSKTAHCPTPRAIPGHLTCVKLRTVGNMTQNEAHPVGHLTFMSKHLSAVGSKRILHVSLIHGS